MLQVGSGSGGPKINGSARIRILIPEYRAMVRGRLTRNTVEDRVGDGVGVAELFLGNVQRVSTPKPFLQEEWTPIALNLNVEILTMA